MFLQPFSAAGEASLVWYFWKHKPWHSGAWHSLHQYMDLLSLHCWHRIWRTFRFEPSFRGIRVQNERCRSGEVKRVPSLSFIFLRWVLLWVLGFCIDLVGESVQVWFLQPIVSHSATRAKAILLRKVNIVYSMGSMAASRLDLYSSHAFIREASIMNQKRGCQNFRSTLQLDLNIAAILVKRINQYCPHVKIVVPHSWSRRSWNLPLSTSAAQCWAHYQIWLQANSNLWAYGLLF